MMTFFKRIYNASVARLFLQISVAIGGLVPISAGFMGILLGPALGTNESVTNISLDSHFRYLSGLLLGIGFAFWALIPEIEKKTVHFQTLSAIVVLGGLGRLYSLTIIGVPDRPMLLGLVMELIIMPLLALWQLMIASPRERITREHSSE